MMTEKDRYKYLRNLQCCRLCCLRYLGYRNNEYYINAVQCFEKLGFEESVVEPPVKRSKENICVTCLDLLHEDTMSNILKELKLSEKMDLYDSSNIVCALTLPICLNLRALSIWLALLKEFPDSFSKETPPDVPLKEVWKFIFGPKLVDTFGITLAPNGSLISIDLEYERDEIELGKLLTIKPEIFNNRRKGQKINISMISRKSFEVNITPKNIDYEEFVKHCNIPPEIPNSGLRVKSINILGDTLFLAGRYNKFSRVLCQTPWILDGKRMAESSVQEIIQEPIIKLFMCNPNLVRFSSSGREDVDVRCLGSGRPFVLEMPDTRYTKVTASQLRDTEKEINKCSDLMVRDLQIVKREELVHIKQGEETKTKQYRALCICTGVNVVLTKEIMDVLTIPEGFELQQKTPIRVLHRRPLITRPRFIHSMKAELLEGHPNLFYLDLATQAGTYVKEFVHGDFGRTAPNVKEILAKHLNNPKINVDIVALDVTAVNLDWPPSIKQE